MDRPSPHRKRPKVRRAARVSKLAAAREEKVLAGDALVACNLDTSDCLPLASPAASATSPAPPTTPPSALPPPPAPHNN